MVLDPGALDLRGSAAQRQQKEAAEKFALAAAKRGEDFQYIQVALNIATFYYNVRDNKDCDIPRNERLTATGDAALHASECFMLAWLNRISDRE